MPKRNKKAEDKQEEKQEGFLLDYIKVSQMPYNLEEKVEEKIAKHALLEALFQTQLWSEPYVKNPFIYVTDNDEDFQNEEGIHLKQYFKKVFYHQYMKGKEAVNKAMPAEPNSQAAPVQPKRPPKIAKKRAKGKQ